jgi:hypothetical protein
MTLLLLIVLLVVVGIGFVLWLSWWFGWRTTEVVLVDEDEYIDPMPGFIGGAMIGGAIGAIAAEEIIENERAAAEEEEIVAESDE